MKAAKEAEEIDQFWFKIEESKDLEDNLQDLTDFLQKNTGATGVYMGKLVYPSKDIDDDADGDAHLDKENPKVVKYLTASQGHEFMVDVVLGPEDGITHDVFKEQEDEDKEDNEGEEGEKAKSAEVDVLKSYKGVVYVPEVIREKRIHFQRVPKLGSFMAVPLVYNSCLYDEALEAAVDNAKTITEQREVQAREKQEYDEQLEAKVAAAQANNETLEEEEKVWESLEFAPFQTQEEKYVICFDTMGQDREFTDKEKMFVFNTMRKFKDLWELEERNNLTQDRDRKLAQLGEDKEELEKKEEEAVNAMND